MVDHALAIRRDRSLLLAIMPKPGHCRWLPRRPLQGDDHVVYRLPDGTLWTDGREPC